MKYLCKDFLFFFFVYLQKLWLNEMVHNRILRTLQNEFHTKNILILSYHTIWHLVQCIRCKGDSVSDPISFLPASYHPILVHSVSTLVPFYSSRRLVFTLHCIKCISNKKTDMINREYEVKWKVCAGISARHVINVMEAEQFWPR